MLNGLRAVLTCPANRGHRCAMFWQWVVANVWRRLSHKPRVLKAFGYEIVAHPDCSVSYCISWVHGGLFDYDPMNFFKRFMPSDGVAFDVGANVGAYSLMFASCGKGVRVIAVEPCGVAFERLRQNVQRNALADRVHLVNKAAGQEPGTLVFAGDALTSHTRVKQPGDASGDAGGGVNMPVTTLDEVAQERGLDRLDFVKIDVEGYEEPVILGARRVLAELKPKAILFEANGLSLQYGIDLGKAFALLGELGYRIGFYRHRDNRIELLSPPIAPVSPENDYLAFSRAFLDAVRDSCRLCGAGDDLAAPGPTRRG